MRRFSTLIAFAALAGNASRPISKRPGGLEQRRLQGRPGRAPARGGAGRRTRPVLPGEAFNKGRGEVQDYAEAANWYRKAAAQNNVDAQETLCGCTSSARPASRRITARRSSFACRRASREAVSRLSAALHARVRQRRRDRSRAGGRACTKSRPKPITSTPQEALGRMYFFGQGVTQDYAEPPNGIAKPRSRGAHSPQFLMAYAFDYGTARQGSGRGGELVPQSRRARRRTGDERARLFVLAGQRRQKDEAEAIKWYLKAAEKGDTSVYNALGWAYYQGTGVTADPAEAVEWFLARARSGDAQAQFMVGYLYDQGKPGRKTQRKRPSGIAGRRAGQSRSAEALGRLISPAMGCRWITRKRPTGTQAGRERQHLCAVSARLHLRIRQKRCDRRSGGGRQVVRARRGKGRPPLAVPSGLAVFRRQGRDQRSDDGLYVEQSRRRPVFGRRARLPPKSSAITSRASSSPTSSPKRNKSRAIGSRRSRVTMSSAVTQ